MTREKLKRCLRYNPCTGAFVWRSGRRCGKRAGAINADGYVTIKIQGRTYKAARLAWLYTYGEWPNIIDHIDRDPGYDSIWNLANGTLRDNARNTKSYVGGRQRSLYRTGSRLRYNHPRPVIGVRNE